MTAPPDKRRFSWARVLVALACVGAVAAGALFFAESRGMFRPVIGPTAGMIAAATQLDLRATAIEPPPVPAEPETERQKLLAAAHKRLGIPYKWAAKGPDLYDCSGFTKAAYKDIGVSIPDGSFNQAKGEQPLDSLDDLAPGDLLFYRWPGEKGVKHVTLYWGEGWAIGTGSPMQPAEVTIYPLASDFAAAPGTVVTYRHIVLSDED